ncbi:MAG: flippase-like domain-containing protein [Anaerolineae bacterium]|nr:flippase-like domain-containing protein [Anaerolineae bacterium]
MKPFFQLRYLFWLVVPVLLGWALRDTSLPEIGVVLGRLTLTQITALILANAMVLLLFSARWWLILRALGHPIPYLTLTGYRLAAFGVSYFTPGPQFGGEPLQVYLVERQHGVPRPRAISAVTVDKTLELVSNFSFLLIGTATMLRAQWFGSLSGQSAIFFALALLALVTSFLGAIWAGRHPLSGLWSIAINLLPRSWLRNHNRILSISQTISDSERQATRFCREHPAIMGQTLAVSVVSWAAIIGEYWLALSVLGLSLTPAQVIGMLTAARIAFLLPLPGGLGALEASQVMALSAMGLNPAVGISLSLLIRARDIILGSLGLWWGSLTLRSTHKYSKVILKS